MKRPIALTIAGSDSGGGAGIQADLKTFAMLGCFGTSAITAVTAQNTQGVQGVLALAPDFVVRQIESVAVDLKPAATKTGMIGSAACVEAVARAVTAYGLTPLVVDPVMIAKGGQRLVDDAVVSALIRALLPLATVVTPNRFEAARMVGSDISTPAEAAAAAETICRQMGAEACVVKGVHDAAAGDAIDALYIRASGEHHLLEAPWHADDQRNTHGSGCTFSAAITAGLARGLSLWRALEDAKAFTNAAIMSPVRLGGGVSPVDHLAGQR